MSKVAISEEYLTDIADSIREKLDSQDTYKVSEMSEAIDSIETGGGGLDWSVLGYEGMPQFIIDGYNYAINVKNDWQPANNLSSKFANNLDLVFMPTVDTSTATVCHSMFSQCSRLLKVGDLDLSNTTTVQNLFSYCIALQEIGELNLSKATDLRSFATNCKNLIKLGGLKNLGMAYLTTQSTKYSRYTLDLSSHTLLTHDSLMNVINNLYDIKTKGCNEQELKIGATNLAKLTEQEVAIATNKGWIVD